MSDDKGTEPTTTDEKKTEDKPLGAAGEKALKEEREARKKAEAELADLRKWKADRELEDLRAEVASAKGLSAEQVDALVGSTKEELEAHATKLQALVPKPSAAPHSRPKEALRSGASNPDDQTVDVSKLADRVLTGGI